MNYRVVCFSVLQKSTCFFPVLTSPFECESTFPSTLGAYKILILMLIHLSLQTMDTNNFRLAVNHDSIRTLY